jgi:hypothetical protein
MTTASGPRGLYGPALVCRGNERTDGDAAGCLWLDDQDRCRQQ